MKIFRLFILPTASHFLPKLLSFPMHHSKPRYDRRRRRRWCCSFTTPPLSPDNAAALSRARSLRSHASTCNKKSELSSPQTQHHQKPPLARRILSPGRVSPISDHPVIPLNPPRTQSPPPAAESETSAMDEGNSGVFDVRLNLRGRNGGSLILELSSEVLAASSALFANLISDHRKKLGGPCTIEVPDVENLNVFREMMELMFEDDIQKKLVKIGVFRAIDILEVSVGIKFTRGISSCLKYLEAVPWTEEEEDKLTELFTKLKIDDNLTAGISDRLFTLNFGDTQRTLTKHLISSIVKCTDTNARNELKSLVKGVISESSVYETDHPDLNRDDIFAICESSLGSLITLFEEATGLDDQPNLTKTEANRPLLERISKEVDNLNWLFEILFNRQMAEDFVDVWANQKELLRMHDSASPMVRYELSRVSAMIFIAMGSRKLHCRSETRSEFLRAWFKPMLLDFGWLQRCKKGLDVKALEEAMGQALLTLPLREQHTLFMDWFHGFSKRGTECPNLSKAFQIWWRRSFLRGSESFAIETR